MPAIKKASGNMYTDVTNMWSPGKGCPHQCTYCYVTSRHYVQPVEFTPDASFPNLQNGRKYFIGHTIDLGANDMDPEFVRSVLNHCKKYDNEYWFQSKNPHNLIQYDFPKRSTAGTTIETNRAALLAQFSKAPSPANRSAAMRILRRKVSRSYITIEPILDFDIDLLTALIVQAQPDWVHIGADSKHHHLPEPSRDKILDFINALAHARIEIKKKTNLERLMK